MKDLAAALLRYKAALSTGQQHLIRYADVELYIYAPDARSYEALRSAELDMFRKAKARQDGQWWEVDTGSESG